MPSGGEPAVLLVGCGNMGRALLEGWLDRGLAAAAITIVEPDGTRIEDLVARGVNHVRGANHLQPAAAADVVVLAVKPQMMDTVLPDLRHLAAAEDGGAVFLSIAAGRTIAGIAAVLGDATPIVRSMPNTPAAVRSGITVACASPAVTTGQRAVCDSLLAAVGSVVWVEDEGLLDPVTAVSGSGPAYLFLLVECLADAGREAGLPPDLADRLARETVIGAGALLARSDLAAAQLRQNVTSPGGTTAAALDVLMDRADGLAPLMRQAVGAATRRARELAG
jgi:pyrroline-5-carboxylate reductase